MSSYLIVATYNHEVHDFFRQAEESSGDERREQARQKAIELFMGETNGTYGYDSIPVPEDETLSNYFTFVDAFKYFEVPSGIADATPASETTVPIESKVVPDLREQILGSKPYGWVGIVPDEETLNRLKDKIEWPGSPFCHVFDIQIIPLQGNHVLPESKESAGVWKTRGQDIYNHQTPAMWRK